jgi:myo-inositol-1(or 4)-monophosphatase
MDLEQIKRTATAAAYRGGSVLRRFFGNIRSVRKKGAIDLVTEADTTAERVIIETIRSRYPEHTLLAEESGFSQGQSENMWYIDPLDGTTNFAHQVGLFAVSIAYAHRGELQVGVIYCPVSGEYFSALKGAGAECNGVTVKVSTTSLLRESLLVTGFPYDHAKHVDPLMARFQRALLASQGVRRLGSAALDLCYVACGRFDGFWEEHLSPWDTAAGALLVAEAGGRVTDFSANTYGVDGPEILATNGKIHAPLIELLSLKDDDDASKNFAPR